MNLIQESTFAKIAGFAACTTKDRKKVWVPTCSECGHVVNYRSRQCSNPEDRRLIVWSDKDLYFDFPENPQNDYTTEQLEVIDPREQSDEVIIKEEEDVTPSETEDQEEENPSNEDTNENPSGVTSDFDDLDWAEDDWAEEEGDDFVMVSHASRQEGPAFRGEE